MDKIKMDKVRVMNMLNKPLNYGGVYFDSYKSFFISQVVKVECYNSNNMDKYNRIKFNRMDNNKEQDIYIAKLNKEVIKYKAILKSGGFISINKFLFDGFKSLNDGLSINMGVM